MLRRTFVLGMMFILLGVFQGCMPKATPYKPAKIERNKVLVYVYRPESFLQRGVGWSIMVNGKFVHRYFINNSYVPVYAKAGDVEVQLMQYYYPHHVYDMVVIKDAKAGSIYYVKAIGGAFAMNKLKIMDSNTAQKEISETQYYEDIKD